MKKRTVITIVVLLVIIGGGLTAYRYWNNRNTAPVVSLQVVSVKRGDIVSTVNVAGSIVPEKQVPLAFKTAGRVTEVLVEETDRAEAGDVLARLETADLELQVAQAKAALAMNEAQLEQIRKGARPEDITVAEAALASAQASYQRVAAGPSAEDLAAAEANLASAQADYEKVRAGPSEDEIAVAQANLDQTEATLRQAQAAYDRVAGSPFIGVLPESLQLESATIAYEQATANYNLTVNISDSELKAAVARVAQAEAQLAQLSNNPTAEDLAIAQAQVDQAQATLDKLKAGATVEELAIAQAQVDQTSASLAQAELRLAQATIIAPSAGTVAYIGLQVGELVPAGTRMITFVDLSGYHIDVDIDETDIGRVEVGQLVSVSLDAFPDEKLAGKVTQIDPLGTVIQGVVNYQVGVALEPTDIPIKPGMTANCDIVVEKRKDVLLVSNRAIKRDREGKYVDVLVGDQLQKTYITIALSNGTVTEVIAGLEEEAQVVVSGSRQSFLEEMSGLPFGGSQ